MQPHPAFAAHFTDPLYEDRAADLAPFGSDEGDELLLDWEDRGDELDQTATIATILECEPGEETSYAGPMEGVDGMDTATFVVSAAFIVLRLTGHLSETDRQLALAAVDHQIRMLPIINADITATPTELQTQRDDLATWTNP